ADRAVVVGEAGGAVAGLADGVAAGRDVEEAGGAVVAVAGAAVVEGLAVDLEVEQAAVTGGNERLDHLQLGQAVVGDGAGDLVAVGEVAGGQAGAAGGRRVGVAVVAADRAVVVGEAGGAVAGLADGVAAGRDVEEAGGAVVAVAGAAVVEGLAVDLEVEQAAVVGGNERLDHLQLGQAVVGDRAGHDVAVGEARGGQAGAAGGRRVGVAVVAADRAVVVGEAGGAVAGLADGVAAGRDVDEAGVAVVAVAGAAVVEALAIDLEVEQAA